MSLLSKLFCRCTLYKQSESIRRTHFYLSIINIDIIMMCYVLCMYVFGFRKPKFSEGSQNYLTKVERRSLTWLSSVSNAWALPVRLTHLLALWVLLTQRLSNLGQKTWDPRWSTQQLLREGLGSSRWRRSWWSRTLLRWWLGLSSARPLTQTLSWWGTLPWTLRFTPMVTAPRPKDMWDSPSSTLAMPVHHRCNNCERFPNHANL